MANRFLGIARHIDQMRTGTKLLGMIIALGLAACGSTPDKAASASMPLPGGPNYTPIPGELALPDRTAFAQKDPRWALETLGGSGEPLETDGCLVTATAMALGNLGFQTDPGDLNTKLKKVNGFTTRGWLIWSGIDRATSGQATARYYNEVSAGIIDGCLMDGFYPLTSFDLPNGRTHWAVILRKSQYGYHMRDPLHPSNQPLIFPQGVDKFKAVRCVGMKG